LTRALWRACDGGVVCRGGGGQRRSRKGGEVLFVGRPIMRHVEPAWRRARAGEGVAHRTTCRVAARRCGWGAGGRGVRGPRGGGRDDYDLRLVRLAPTLPTSAGRRSRKA
jgi:hypothetical protein